jgi:type III secretion protein R
MKNRMEKLVGDPLGIILFAGLMALVPVAAVLVTSYSKLVIVFFLLRQALGLQQVPPGLVLNSLALLLSVYIMLPAFTALGDSIERYQPQEKMTVKESLEKIVAPVKEPLRDFLKKHTSPKEVQYFVAAAERINTKAGIAAPREDDFMVLIPAFSVSELSAAFVIGFLIFLPFIAIDLIVANILLSLGMQMLSPTIVSLPLKLLLFVALDGWSVLVHQLVRSY